MGVKIITDNCCDLPVSIIQQYDIKVVHMLVSFGVKEYRPQELSTARFYEMMTRAAELPTTSQPTLEELLATYEECLADGSEAVAIHLSSGLSGTVQSARMAAEMIAGKGRVTVIDSLKASVGEGLLVLKAARMAREGLSRAEITREVLKLQESTRCVFTLNTLEYLVKGGRISRTKGLMGSVLDIKPILWVNPHGYIEPLDKVRGRRNALRRLISIVKEIGGDLEGQTVGVSHALCPEEAGAFQDVFVKEFGAGEVVVGEIGPVIGSHVGPGTLAVFFSGQS